MKSERQYVGSSFHTSTLRVITLFSGSIEFYENLLLSNLIFPINSKRSLLIDNINRQN